MKAANPSAADGTYPLTVGGQSVPIYCKDMATSPKEYISLVNTGGSANTAYYGEGGNTSPGGLTTSYTKVRFNPASLIVDTTDTTFSTSSGWKLFGTSYFYSNDYADAADCLGGWSQTGTANVDLTGTAFAVAPAQFSPQGYIPAGTATYSANDQVVNLTGGGDCGDMETTVSGQLTLVLSSQ